MNEQVIIKCDNDYLELQQYLKRLGCSRILLVCGSSIDKLKVGDFFKNAESKTGLSVFRFSGFKPNPDYLSVVDGVRFYLENECEAVVAVGGGSAMDVAKCIKLFATMDHLKSYLEQTIVPNDIPFIAVPTTAGTGSEATRFAVIYKDGEKQSVSDYSSIPEAVMFDPDVLRNVPEYHKKAAMLDAFCHAVESYWSVNSTDESKNYAMEAIKLLVANMDAYLSGDHSVDEKIMLAANLAGKAINITQTTAGHAMCYKLTTLFGLAHGHSAMLCVRKLYPWMAEHLDQCIDPRGDDYLRQTLTDIAAMLGCEEIDEASGRINEIFEKLDLEVPKPTKDQYDILVNGVNVERLKNHPVRLEKEDIEKLYHEILGDM
ncbi:MAG: phosphonoacetaldehyde reductase [Butyrivibrio sp.]|nr:phosphonoacetaldehyde reductase [Butyrivibrio sp.]